MGELGPGLALTLSEVSRLSDGLLACKSFWFLKGVFLVFSVVVAETTEELGSGF